MTGRQNKFLQHKGLQISYWRGAKKCMKKILQEKDQCGILLKTIHQQMNKSHSMVSRGAEKPTWIEDPGREKTDVLDTPCHG